MSQLKFLLLLSALSFNVQAELSFCKDSNATWSKTKPSVNLTHVFCGESHHGKNKGFHSTYLMETSPIVSGIRDKKSLGGGLYSARVKFNNGNTKFSTFFPNHCNLATILRSIIYASSHSTGKHRQWGVLGQSAPKAMEKGYCLLNNGKPFTIRMGLTRQKTGVNTAFPQP